jgi:hypothetical protein
MIRQLVDSVNGLTKLMLQDLAPKLQGAHIGEYLNFVPSGLAQDPC